MVIYKNKFLYSYSFNDLVHYLNIKSLLFFSLHQRIDWHSYLQENPSLEMRISLNLIIQGKIGQLVTSKPVERRAILEEAAGIAGIHVRRHEAETRLNAAENNLKRADELRRQQEKQLANLQKQAEEATRYKNISDEIKKI